MLRQESGEASLMFIPPLWGVSWGFDLVTGRGRTEGQINVLFGLEGQQLFMFLYLKTFQRGFQTGISGANNKFHS